MRQRAGLLQHERGGRSAEGVFLLLRIQRLLGQIHRSLGRGYAGPVLLQGELRVADFDADFVLHLLQAQLGLAVFQLGTNLVGLRRAVAQMEC